MNHKALTIFAFYLAATACGAGEHLVGETMQETTQGADAAKPTRHDGDPGSAELNEHGHDSAGAPTCPPVAGSPIHFSVDDLGNPIRWEEDDCIAVTHAAGADAEAELVSESLKRLEALECLGLCFSDPEVGPAIDPADPTLEGSRIHVHLGSIEGKGQGPLRAEVTFERKGGRIRAVDLLIDPTGIALTPNVVLHEAAHSLGSSHSENSNSALYYRYDRDEPTKELTEDDIEAFCAVYEGRAQTCK